MRITNFIAIYLPYCLRLQNNGTYAVLNRNYKPVGFNTESWIDYDDFPVTSKIERIGPGTAKKLSYNNSSDVSTIYLYNDGCNPVNSNSDMENYLKKLRILAKLTIEA